jgi:hypothetical protein
MIWFKVWKDSRKHALGGLAIVLVIAIVFQVFVRYGLAIYQSDPSHVPNFVLLGATLPDPHAAAFPSAVCWVIYLTVALLIAPFIGIITAGSGLGVGGAAWTAPRPSTIYTLSLPVSRSRWLAARAVIGFLEMTALVVLLMTIPIALSPLTGSNFSLASALRSTPFLILAAGVSNAISVFFSAFLDEQWQVVASVCVVFGLATTAMAGKSASGAIVSRFVTGITPSVAGIALCAAIMAALFCSALWIVERQEG